MPRGDKLNEEMRAQSRAQILSTAARLFAEQGYFNTKVATIAREAEMSHGNVYWYFSGKEEILKAVLADGFEALEALFDQAENHPGTPAEVVDFLVDGYMALAAQQRHFFAIFVSLLGHGGIPLLQELGFDTPEIGRRYHQHLSAVFRRAQANTPESKMATIDADVLPFLFFSFFNGLWLMYPEWEELPRRELRDAALRLIGYGCPAEDGR